jgi:glucan phosphorylase
MGKYDKMIDRLAEVLQSEEVQAATKKFVEEMYFQENVFKPNWIERIKKKIDEFGADYVIEKLLDKYDSNDYVNREYRCGREPMEILLYTLLDYARVYCKPSDEDNHWGMFIEEVYYIGSYVIKLAIGQGSKIILRKTNEI